MKSTSEYLAILRSFMQKHAEKYGILSMGIFGSVARGEQHAELYIPSVCRCRSGYGFNCYS